MKNKKFGWIKDIRDNKDFIGLAPVTSSVVPVSECDLRKLSFMPPYVNQLMTNSCVGNATSSIFRFMLRKLGKQDFQPSRLFTYYFARAQRGWENEDEGCMPRDAMQSLISNGTIREGEWPFSDAPQIVNSRPPQPLLASAKANKVIEGKYVRMLANDNLYHLKYSLFQLLPFTIGIPCFSSFFDTGSDGIVKMPKSNETIEGFHLMWVAGYSDAQKLFIAPNSWGEDWGDHGCCYLPFDFVSRYGDDLWRIEGLTSS